MSSSMEQEILNEFIVEAKELLEKLESDFVKLESEKENVELINEIFRSVHTVKGGAGFLGLDSVLLVSHRMEDILNKLRKGDAQVTPDVIDPLLQGLDTLTKLIDAIEQEEDVSGFDISVVDNLIETFVRMDSSLVSAGEYDENNSEESSEETTSSKNDKPAIEPQENKDESEELERVADELASIEQEEDATLDVDLFSEEMADLVEGFMIETDEILEKLDQDFIRLESNPDDDDTLNSIFRGMHTIKGTSSFLGLDLITKLSHKAEDVLNDLRKDVLTVSSDIMDVLLETADMLKILMNDVMEKNIVDRDINPLVSTLLALRGQEAGQSTESAKPAAGRERKAEQPVEKAGAPKTAHKVVDKTIRVDVDRLDSLMNLVSELVLRRNALTQFNNRFEKMFEDSEFVEELGTTTANINYLTTELQFAVMQTRMLPIGKVFNKFTRIVRDLSREFSKKINLEISGSETELDKSLIEEINDPLVHIIRNATDHGIESPETRIVNNKSETGNIHLYAAQEGNNIIIGIKDDGKGLDPDKLRAKAVEKGMLTEAEAERMPDKDAFNLIFAPGFSMAEKVTNISGRGVGMDVVKTNISKLNGTVDIDSEIGEGTRFTIKLPLTLAIIQGLMVGVEDEIFAIPLASVMETARVSVKDIMYINQREVINLRNSILPLVRLTNLFDIAEKTNGRDTIYIVVLGLAEEKIGLVVSRMLGQEEVVIKSLGENLGKTRGVSGATIMGDGRVRMILEIRDVFEMAKEEGVGNSWADKPAEDIKIEVNDVDTEVDEEVLLEEIVGKEDDGDGKISEEEVGAEERGNFG